MRHRSFWPPSIRQVQMPSIAGMTSSPRGEEFVSNAEPMHRILETINLAQTLKEISMKHNSISKSLVLVKTNAKRLVMALLLGFATLSLAVSGMNSTASAQNGTPANVQGTWLTAITRINQVGQDFTALMSLSAGGVWQATGANDRLNGVFHRCTAVGSALARIATAQKRISSPLTPAATRLSYSESMRFSSSKTRINSKELVKVTSVHCKARAKTV